jgi:chorismate mutase/prephenate dehydratase
MAVTNNLTGTVLETELALKGLQYEVVSSIDLNILNSVCARTKIEDRDIRLVIFHCQPLKQCPRWIELELDMPEMWQEKDTALAAQRMSAKDYPQDSVVICPPLCADYYDLMTLHKDVSDAPSITRFILIRLLPQNQEKIIC